MPKERERLPVRIGRFHQFAHGIGCQINYSTMRTDGYRLMIGEEPEQIWFQMSSLVISGRVSSGARRTQKINSWGLYNSQQIQSILGENINRCWMKMGMMRANTNEVLQRLSGVILPDRTDSGGAVRSRVQITRKYLDDQIKDQIKHYENFSLALPPFIILMRMYKPVEPKIPVGTYTFIHVCTRLYAFYKFVRGCTRLYAYYKFVRVCRHFINLHAVLVHVLTIKQKGCARSCGPCLFRTCRRTPPG